MENVPEHCPGTDSENAGKSEACAGCPNQNICASSKPKEPDPDIDAIKEKMSLVKHIFLVLSGKGGVGKSTFTSILAYAFAEDSSKNVAVMDIDICGPSMPRIFGVENEQVHLSGSGWSPVFVEENLSVMSVGFLLSGPEEAVIWRGPKKNGLIKQFMKDVDWGELDYLVIDTPPGTSDEHLSIVQYLQGTNIEGAVIVTTPQETSLLDVRKEISFCQKVKLPILGVVENMSGFVCPKCNVVSEIFPPKTGGGKKMAADMGVSFLGSIPLNSQIGKACDEGKSFLEDKNSPATIAAKNVVKGLCPTQKVTAEAAISQQQARNTKKLCDDLNAAGQKQIRAALSAREKKIRYWRQYLNAEIDRLAKQYEANEEALRDLFKNSKYFADLARISQATADFRRNIEDCDPNDDINKLIKEEMTAISTASDSMKQHSDELNKCQRKIQATRNDLMSEVEAKSMNWSINKRCQHAEPLLSFPYTSEDHPVDQLYHPNTEEQWETEVAKKIEDSTAARKEASDSCCRAKEAVIKNHTDTAKAFYNTSKAIKESVQKTERQVFNLTDVLNTIMKSLSASEQRIESFKNDSATQSRLKTLELWRLQMLTHRPGKEHIQDSPAQKMENELRENKKRDSFIWENLNQNKELIKKLIAQQEEKTLELERLSRKLFIEKENCLGIRRTNLIEGTNTYDYVSD